MSKKLVEKEKSAMPKGSKIAFHSELKDVQLKDMKVSRLAQRQLRSHRVDQLHANFDPEFFGIPVVSFRQGHYWIVDGQHRVEAAKKFLGQDWASQAVTCRVYAGMTERDEADMYLRLNNTLPSGSFDKFSVGVTANRPIETAVAATVAHAGLHITLDRTVEGHVTCPTTLCAIVTRADVKTLARTLNLVYQSFGTPGLTAPVINGTAQVCERYNGAFNDKTTIDGLKDLRGGVGALLTRAGAYRRQTGNQLAYCFAAALVEEINRKHPGKKLASWWKTEK